MISDLRARRGEPPPTPGPAGRIESAEMAVRALEERLGSILRRIEDSEEQRRRAVDRLAQSERQIQLERSARERAESLAGSMRSAQRRVALVVADLRVLAARLRASAEGDQGASVVPPAPSTSPEGPCPAPPGEAAVMPPEPGLTAPGGPEPRSPAGPAVTPPELTPDAGPAAAGEAALDEEATRSEMTDALAAAITRLRERVAAAREPRVEGEAETSAGATPRTEEVIWKSPPRAPARVEEIADAQRAPEGTQPGQVVGPRPVALLTRTIASPDGGRDWLAGAIRRVAERRDPRMAAELIVELLPARRPRGDRPLSYGVQIAELGAFHVRFLQEGGRAVRPERAPGGLDTAEPDFVLQGTVDAFVRLAAGGGRGRALRHLRVHGSRRSARRLAAAARAPLSLAELARGGVEVWPGLLLLALAEAIEPAWTAGRRLAVAFAIEGPSVATVRANVRDGEPVLITRERRGEEPPALTVHLSERAFVCLFAGVRLPAEERLAFEGDLAALQALLDLTDRAQGLS